MPSTSACAFLPRSAMSKIRKVSPARNAIKAKYASLMPHSRKSSRERMRKEGHRSRLNWNRRPGARPRAHPCGGCERIKLAAVQDAERLLELHDSAARGVHEFTQGCSARTSALPLRAH